jgi:3-hydroxyacyl-CoA dehydrogenase
MLALRHARIPTIAVTRGVAISGGCEVLMHCTRVVAATRAPIGLVETSIGVLPGGGGVKEMARRAALRSSDELRPALERAFAALSAARIVYARDAKAVDLLSEHDVVTDDADLLSIAKKIGRALQNDGYEPPPCDPTIRVGGADMVERLLAAQSATAEAITTHQWRASRTCARPGPCSRTRPSACAENRRTSRSSSRP